MGQEFAGFKLEQNGVPLLWCVDRRFKTFRLTLACQRPLDQRAAARVVLPGLLLQGTGVDPDRPSLARRMERLYGAMVAPAVSRLGESQILRFSLDCVAGDFLPDHPDQLGQGLEFLGDYLAHPKLDGDGFPAATFERERRQVLAAARGVFDDKGAYAAQEARRHAFAGEPLAIPDHGGVEALEALTRVDPEAARRDALARGRLWIVAMGALPEDLRQRLGALSEALPDNQPAAIPEPVEVGERTPRRMVEHADMQQSKQVLVFRMPRPGDARQRAAATLASNILGGGPHSRLFREVREKQSLAYNVSTALDAHKGAMMVRAGLDAESAAQVETEVLRQIELVGEGGFEQAELDTARATILGPFAAVHDSIPWRMQFTVDQWLLGEDCTPEDKVAVYRSIEKSEVMAAARSLWLDFSYLLAPEEEGKGAS